MDTHWISSVPIAHRGLNSDTIPENSMASFEAAIAKQYAIELDIHLLADGNIAVFHDEDLQRVTGVEGKIADQTAAQVQQLKLLHTDQTVPLIEEALALVQGKVPLLIEIKSKDKSKVGTLEPTLMQKLADYTGDYAIQTFNPYSLEWFKHHAPQVPRGQLSGNFKGEDLTWSKKLLLSNLLLNAVSRPHFIGYDIQALPHPAPAIARQWFKIPIVAWTVRSETDRAKAEKVADNIIFEHILP